MIDTTNEELLTFSQLAHQMPVKREVQALKRWASSGILNRSTGRHAYLETVLIGGERYTSMEAFQRFVNKLNEENDDD